MRALRDAESTGNHALLGVKVQCCVLIIRWRKIEVDKAAPTVP